MVLLSFRSFSSNDRESGWVGIPVRSSPVQRNGQHRRARKAPRLPTIGQGKDRQGDERFEANTDEAPRAIRRRDEEDLKVDLRTSSRSKERRIGGAQSQALPGEEEEQKRKEED